MTKLSPRPLPPLPTTSFVTQRLNASTFLIAENDLYGEQPYIYVKIHPTHIILTDTGCNAPLQPSHQLTTLRLYLETYPLPLNNHHPLNPSGQHPYIIILTHCHYDHILGISQFLSSNPIIVASELGKSFIENDLPTNSLCKYIPGVTTPSFKVTHWAKQLEYFSLGNTHFRMQFLQIPGHTPDSLAWYDLTTYTLFTGDTLYTLHRTPPIPTIPPSGRVPSLPASQAAIIFPEEGGSIIQYMSSLRLLISFVQHRNADLSKQGQEQDQKQNEEQASTSSQSFSHARTVKNENPSPTPSPHKQQQQKPRVVLSASHLTHSIDAEISLLTVQALFQRIIAGDVPVKRSGEKRGVMHDYWVEGDETEAQYGVMAPRHLVEEARKHFGVTLIAEL